MLCTWELFCCYLTVKTKLNNNNNIMKLDVMCLYLWTTLFHWRDQAEKHNWRRNNNVAAAASGPFWPVWRSAGCSQECFHCSVETTQVGKVGKIQTANRKKTKPTAIRSADWPPTAGVVARLALPGYRSQRPRGLNEAECRGGGESVRRTRFLSLRPGHGFPSTARVHFNWRSTKVDVDPHQRPCESKWNHVWTKYSMKDVLKSQWYVKLSV